MAQLPEDHDLLERARARALKLLADDPELARAEHALLRLGIARRFGASAVERVAA